MVSRNRIGNDMVSRKALAAGPVDWYRPLARRRSLFQQD
jgi:hypothetical protein